jgi:hypothetical protein
MSEMNVFLSFLRSPEVRGIFRKEPRGSSNETTKKAAED